MPASRSRTERYRELLHQVCERGGAIEVSVERAGAKGGVAWRVRLLRVEDEAGRLVVEMPAAAGGSLSLGAGVSMEATVTVGQNKWAFHTRTVGTVAIRTDRGYPAVGLLLAMPESVERCSRRVAARVSPEGGSSAVVRCWPLSDPERVIPAEAANRAQIGELLLASGVVGDDGADPARALASEVADEFPAELGNISGGGLGLWVEQAHSSAVDRRRFLWVRLDLRPQVPAPVYLVCRRVHTRLDSSGRLAVGLAFEFAHNPTQQRFVAGLFARYLERLEQGSRGEQRAA